MSTDDLLVVAGEASGDLLGGAMLEHLNELVPGVHAYGLGGDELGRAGLEAIAHSSEISVIGIVEALKILPRARRIFRQILDEVDRRGTRVAVLVDSPDFNLRLAAKLSRRGVRVIYLVSPQVWAWRKGRIKTIAETVDRMLVLFGFEVDLYEEHQVDAVHIGHPLVDVVPRLPQAWERADETPGTEATPYRIALLPGSRQSEIRVLLPILLGAAERLGRELPIRVSLIRASTVPPESLSAALEASPLDVEVVSRGRFERIADSHLALCAVGTATLEVGLLRTPVIVTHRIAFWSAWLGRRLLDLPHTSLVNLVLGREAVPELLQEDAEPGKIAAEAKRLLSDPERIRDMRASLAGLRSRLGAPGAARRAAEQVAEFVRP